MSTTSSLASLLSPARRFGLRRLRLVSGLTLFIYVGLHLTDHALGNISVEAMEAGLRLQKFVWQGWLGTAALYAALLTHFGLGLWALYQRRHYGWTGGEVVQLILGLSIPALLIHHLVVTRLALAIYGLEKGYAQELYSFRVASPEIGWLQLSVLVVAWTHGCLGVYFWLRLKRGFRHAAPVLTAAAVLLPALALLGYYQGGRRIIALAQDPAWRAVNLTPDHVGTAQDNAHLLMLRNGFLWLYGATLLAILAARGFRFWLEQHGRKIGVTYPDGRTIRVAEGFSVLEASLKAGIPHAHFCGGRGRCSTCRIQVVSSSGPLPRPSVAERIVLERIGAPPRTRLACQLRPLDDIAVAPVLPPDATALVLRRRAPHDPARNGEERFVAVLVVDMRNSTRLGAERLPFDTVFIVDRFIEAVGSAVTAAGGRPSQFTGDGMLALFGAQEGPETACAQALRAASLIGAKVQALNEQLAEVLATPIRFGIGIHGGMAVVGEVGYAASRIFTALGEAPNLASRLETVCKELSVELVVSETVCRQSGLDYRAMPRRLVELRGHDEPIVVRIAERAAELAL
jgi:adenylate cyclase